MPISSTGRLAGGYASGAAPSVPSVWCCDWKARKSGDDSLSKAVDWPKSNPNRSDTLATLDGGTGSACSCSGPYNQVTSLSFNLYHHHENGVSLSSTALLLLLLQGRLPKKEGNVRMNECTHQLSVSGLTVLSLPRCLAQVRQLAFSSRTPLAISCFFLVMTFQLDHTSSSVQLCES